MFIHTFVIYRYELQIQQKPNILQYIKRAKQIYYIHRVQSAIILSQYYTRIVHSQTKTSGELKGNDSPQICILFTYQHHLHAGCTF